jgi:prepilin-type N-terminal cleavage/methylation domain-containing protein
MALRRNKAGMNNNNMNKKNHSTQLAFTLIELLVVVAIMGLVAAMVLAGGQYASKVKKETAVKAEREKLETMIDHYQAKLNFYPPDNGNLITNQGGPYSGTYYGLTISNPLIYELTGGTNTNNLVFVFNSNSPPNTGITINGTGSTYTAVFGRGGLANSDVSEPQNFFIPPPMPQDYTNFPGTTVDGLLVPAALTNNMPNFWHYDSSSTNRHNQNSYDLWAEFTVGSKNGLLVIETNGNW